MLPSNYNSKIDEKLILTDDFIRELIRENKNLNFTGYDKNEVGHSSPLTYSIYNNNKNLFNELISAGADINYKLDYYGWSAINYAFRYADDYFIKALINTKKLNHSFKINGMNPLEHTLSSFSYPKISKKDFFNRLELYIKHVEQCNIDIEKFISKEGFFSNSLPDFDKYNFLVKSLPKKWLEKEISIKSEMDYTKNIDLLLTIINIISTSKTKISINKIMNILNPHQILENNNTLFHYYVLDSNQTGLKKYNNGNKIEAHIVESFINRGFLPTLKNKNKISVHDELMKYEFYKLSIIKKNYLDLEEGLVKKEAKESKKIKI